MIITKLMGGLGNQMFQYAAGLNLARKLNYPLKMQMQYFEEPKAWPYQLDLFNIEAAPLRSQDSFFYKNIVDKKIGRVALRVARKTGLGLSPAVFRESCFAYNENFQQITKPVYLEGYWQTDRYFQEIEGELKQHFAPKTPMSRQNQEVIQRMARGNSVSLHIRRGDYLSAGAVQVHGLCGLDYYRKAVEYLKGKYEDLNFFVFSDDPEWVKENLDVGAPFEFINHNRGSDSYWDMILMSYSKHHIIANSTFSWWGAWLAKEKGTTIAPNPWFADKKDTKDLIPKDWIQIG